MKLYVLFAALLLASCQPKNKGFNILPPPQMTNVLWDIMQVDEYATYKIAIDSTKNIKNERIRLYQQVFDIHHVSHKDFSESFKFYSGKPDQMKILFDSLSVRGERERKKLYEPKDTLKASPKINAKMLKKR